MQKKKNPHTKQNKTKKDKVLSCGFSRAVKVSVHIVKSVISASVVFQVYLMTKPFPICAALSSHRVLRGKHLGSHPSAEFRETEVSPQISTVRKGVQAADNRKTCLMPGLTTHARSGSPFTEGKCSEMHLSKQERTEISTITANKKSVQGSCCNKRPGSECLKPVRREARIHTLPCLGPAPGGCPHSPHSPPRLPGGALC